MRSRTFGKYLTPPFCHTPMPSALCTCVTKRRQQSPLTFFKPFLYRGVYNNRAKFLPYPFPLPFLGAPKPFFYQNFLFFNFLATVFVQFRRIFDIMGLSVGKDRLKIYPTRNTNFKSWILDIQLQSVLFLVFQILCHFQSF